MTTAAQPASSRAEEAFLANGGVRRIPAPRVFSERASAAFLQALLRLSFRTFIGPPLSAGMQRMLVRFLALVMPGAERTSRHWKKLGTLPVEVTIPLAGTPAGIVLYLHGGAFCLGSPMTHRSLTSRLAAYGGFTVWTPDYRLAPEHPFPAALEDACACYTALLDQGYHLGEIIIAGDSAGGSLALALALHLRERGIAMPACMLLLSPVTGVRLDGASFHTRAASDPMVRKSWLQQALGWYRCPPGARVHQPLHQDLHGLPPMLIQVGDHEILLEDSIRLAEHARSCGLEATLEIYEERWHVFQLQAPFLQSSVMAIQGLADFAKRRLRRQPAAQRTTS
ncbi:alpha/beta hydrolase [Noviherbaspirillum massiliense]|uniref:alpha/beta hydrolase n=1 Tax=Noviherbaspirillum massiliense TaxID=1465823 RepID=UPI00031E5ED9|nr:alpha/beta hydrolase [Noviherbaspirillum massiliense]